MTGVDLLGALFPHFTGITVEHVVDRGTLVRITASCTEPSGCCPSCGNGSSAVHSGSERSIADTAVGLARGGRAGARLAEVMAIPLSRDTLIRRIRAVPDPPVGVVTVLGVDDFALLKGHVYGAVPVDVLGRRPVDVLPERSAGAPRAWLDAHPGVEVICRDCALLRGGRRARRTGSNSSC
jgi:hypothetical protein